MDIRTLYETARKGDQKAEKRLFELLSARFRHFTDQRIWNQADAEDVVQEALMAIGKEYRAIAINTSFTAWAYKILDNRILHHLAKKQRRNGKKSVMEENAGSPSAASANPDPDLKRRLSECLKKVSRINTRYARALNLHYQGFVTEEICKKMNITPSNLYTLLSRGRSLLEICLEKGRIE